jgi:osmotically-inducible protein OsmY
MKQPSNSPDNRPHIADTRNPDWDKYSPDGHGRTDEQIRADVHDALRDKGGELADSLSVSVGDGVVTLSGKVTSESDQQRLTELVRGIPSVKDLRIELDVRN